MSSIELDFDTRKKGIELPTVKIKENGKVLIEMPGAGFIGLLKYWMRQHDTLQKMYRDD